jgi:hypothetical protein
MNNAERKRKRQKEKTEKRKRKKENNTEMKWKRKRKRKKENNTEMKRKRKRKRKKEQKTGPFNIPNVHANNTYRNQMANAVNMLEMLCIFCVHAIAFIAQMQSGKSNSFFELALQGFNTGKFDKCDIVCGCAEVDLKKDLEKKKNQAFDTRDIDDKLRDLRNEKRLLIQNNSPTAPNNDDLAKIETKISEQLEIQRLFRFANDNTRILFNQDMRTDMGNVYRKRDKVLVIIEECHYGSNKAVKGKKENVLVEWLRKRELHHLLLHRDPQQLSQKLSQKLQYKRVVSVSATMATFIFNNPDDVEKLERNENGSSADSANNKSRIVLGLPGTGYHGVNEMLEGGQIRKIETEDRDEGILTIESLCDMFTQCIEGKEGEYYIVIRLTREEQEENLRTACEECGYDIRYYDSDKTRRKEDMFTLEMFKREPRNITVVVVRGRLTAGHTLCKRYIAGMIETTQKGQGITILQSFIGRGCGYPGDDELRNILYFVPASIIPELESYAKTHGLCLLTCGDLTQQNKKSRTYNCHPAPPICLPLNPSNGDSLNETDPNYVQLDEIIKQLLLRPTKSNELALCKTVAELLLKNQLLLQHQREAQLDDIQKSLTNISEGNELRFTVRHVMNSQNGKLQNESLLKSLIASENVSQNYDSLPPRSAYQMKRGKTMVDNVLTVVLVHCEYPHPKEGHDPITPGTIYVMMATNCGTLFETPPNTRPVWHSRAMSMYSTDVPVTSTKK